MIKRDSNIWEKIVLVGFGIGVGATVMYLISEPQQVNYELTIEQSTTNLEVRNIFIVVCE